MPSCFSVFAIVLAVVAVSGLPTSHVSSQISSFEEYIAQFSKHYDAREYQLRKVIFEANLVKIQTHNAKTTSTHKQNVNKFTDATEQEMKSLFGFDKNLAVHRRVQRSGTNFFKSSKKIQAETLPATVDWTITGALTPVKNQGGCGSCWAFAGTEAIESNIYIQTGKLFTLAPQQFVDCVVNNDDCGGTGGCEGATTDLLFSYAQTAGVFNETDYPYVGQDETCKNLTNPVATIGGFEDVNSNDHLALMEAVVRQPVTVGVAAASWGSYSSGVVSYDDCDSDIDHAVLLVGYGTDPKLGDYWKIRNSWGPDWGESGYIRLARYNNDSSKCQKDATPLDGYGCKNGPKQVTVCGTCGVLYLPSYPVGGRIVKA